MVYYMVQLLYVDIQYIWVNYNDLTATEPWESWLVRGIIPFYGRTIQVSELL